MRTRWKTRNLVVAVVLVVTALTAGLVVAARSNVDNAAVAVQAEEGPDDPEQRKHGDRDTEVVTMFDVQDPSKAAVRFVRSSGEVAKSLPLTRRDKLLALATESYGPRLVKAVGRDLDALHWALGELGHTPDDVLWAEYPLTIDVNFVAGGRADAQVWSVLVIGIEGGSVARQLWRTSTITLEWEDGGWLVDDWATDPGPSPSPWGDADVATVDSLASVIEWPAVEGS